MRSGDILLLNVPQTYLPLGFRHQAFFLGTLLAGCGGSCGQCLQLVLRVRSVRTIHRSRFRKRRFRLRDLFQVKQRKSQPVLVPGVAGIIRLQQRRRRLQVLHRPRIVLPLQIDLAERAQRQSFLQRGLLFPLVLGNVARSLRTVRQRRNFLRIGLGLVELLAFSP